MAAKIRVKCPICGEAVNIHSIEQDCPECKRPMGLAEEGSIYVYRQGSPYGVAGGFGLYLNGEPFGHIGNKELLRIPAKFGTYTVHCAVGMSRKCEDLQVCVTPENPNVYTKVYIKPGFWTNTFAVEYIDPNLLEL